MNATTLRTVSDADLSTNVLRAPPHNFEAERALLGAMLMNNRAHERVSEFLMDSHFADPVNGRVYAIMSGLIEAGQPANPVTMKLAAESDALITAAGGMAYMATLAAGAVTVINAGEYGKLIYDLFLRRELIDVGEDIVNDAFNADPDQPALDQIEGAEERLFNLSATPAAGGLQDLGAVIRSAAAVAEAAHQRRGALVGVTTGLKDLDAKLAGMHPTDLLILAGRPSMGKTALATGAAVAAAQYFKTTDRDEDRGKTVAFFSLEMSGEQLVTRIIAERANLDSHRIRSGHLTDAEFERYIVAGHDLDDLPLKIDDTAAASVAAIRTRARRLARKGKGLGLIVIDYLQLISPGGKERQENRVQEISGITRGLKALAKDLGVPVLALSQLSRAVEQREDKRPQLSDLRESGTIEQDSDVVMFVYREEYYLERTEPTDTKAWTDWNTRIEAVRNLAEVIIGKQRHGPIGTVRLHFEASRTSFSDLERHQAADTAGPSRSPYRDDDFAAGGPPPGHPAAEQGYLNGL